MQLNDMISKQIKNLRLEKGYSLSEIADLIPVSKQGFHQWEQGLRTWKIETLVRLSELLGFELTIQNGELTILEQSFTSSPKPFRNEATSMSHETTHLKGHEILTLWTSVDNVNFEEKEILDNVFVYRHREEVIEVYGETNLVPIYALYELEAGHVYEMTYGLDPIKAYSFYFYNCAPLLDEDGTVYIDTPRDLKVRKAYVVIDIHHPNGDGSYPVLEVSTKETERSLRMFVVTDLNENPIPQFDYVSQSFPLSLD